MSLSIGGDTYCYAPQEHMTVINNRLADAGRPIVLWGCSVDPERLEGGCLRDLKRYDLIVARESITEDAMRGAGLNVVRWCDPAFTMGLEELPLPQGWREGKTIGLNVSPLVLNCAKDKNAALDAFAALVRHILDTSDDAVALIPHVTWAHDNDLDALHAIKARFADEERVFILPGTLNALQYKGYVKRLARLGDGANPCVYRGIFDLRADAGHRLFGQGAGLARDLFGNEDGHLIPAQELSGERELIAAYDAMLAREGDERAHLQARMPEYTAGGERLIADILALGGKSR